MRFARFTHGILQQGKLPISISFASSSPQPCRPQRHPNATFLATPLLTEHMPRKTCVYRKSDMRWPETDKRSKLAVKVLLPWIRFEREKRRA